MVALLTDAEQYTVKEVFSFLFGVYRGVGKCMLGSDSPADPKVCPHVVRMDLRDIFRYRQEWYSLMVGCFECSIGSLLRYMAIT